MTMRLAVILGWSCLWLIGLSGTSRADALQCKRAIARASSAYVQARVKALQRCHDSKAKGRLRASDPCTGDPRTANALAVAHTKLFATINVACGGANRDCGDGDDLSLGAIGWNIGACPGFESAGCTNAIGTCTDVSSCLVCIASAAVDQAVDTYTGSLTTSEFSTSSTVNLCQRALIKGASKFVASRAKALQRCWDRRLAGVHASVCPDPGDGKTVAILAKAEERKVRTICRRCGGFDGLCDGNGDLTPAAVGFMATCPAVTPIGASSCAGPVTDMGDLVDCVDCVAAFKTDCTDAAAIPQLVSPYPAACGAVATTSTTTSTTTSSTTTSTTSSTTTSTTTSTTSSTTTSTTSSTTTSTTEASTTTTSTTEPGSTTTTSTTEPASTTTTTTTSTTTSTTTTTVGSGPTRLEFRPTVGSGFCGQTFRDTGGSFPIKNLECGKLSLGGGASTVPDGPTPAGSANRFALSCTGSSCTVSGAAASQATNPGSFDCTNVGCRFGSPLPVTAGGNSSCVENTFATPVTGTLDTTTGVASLVIELNSRTVLTSNATNPCSTCTVGGNPATPCAGTAAAPCTGVCWGSANQGATCQSQNATGHTRDCPGPASTSAGNKCYGGTNSGGACTSNASCPGGICSTWVGDVGIALNPLTTDQTSQSSATGLFCLGQTAGQVGAFPTNLCFGGTNNGGPCLTNANCPGAGGFPQGCRSASLNNICSAGTNLGSGCATATDCGTGGACTKAGREARLIRTQGVAAGAMVLNVPKALKLGNTFCIPATNSAAINSAANLPGPGATSLQGTFTLLP